MVRVFRHKNCIQQKFVNDTFYHEIVVICGMYMYNSKLSCIALSFLNTTNLSEASIDQS